MADVFRWRPTRQSRATAQAKINSAQFGDGYRQSAADGINAIRQTWDMEFVGKKSEISQIIAFLRAHVGISFIWKDPFEGNLLFQCETFSPSPQGADIYTLTATFEQTFQP